MCFEGAVGMEELSFYCCSNVSGFFGEEAGLDDERNVPDLFTLGIHDDVAIALFKALFLDLTWGGYQKDIQHLDLSFNDES
jgi:hypothetical protein